jgi:hypothetical protein
MSTAVQLKQPGVYETFPDGYYPAKVTDIILVDKQPDRFKDYAYQELRWSWELNVPDRDDRPRYTTWTSLALDPRSNLVPLLRALGVSPSETGVLILEDCIGKSCRINLAEVEYTDSSGAVGFRNKTKGYSPLKPRQSAPATAARPAPRAAPVVEDDDEVPF